MYLGFPQSIGYNAIENMKYSEHEDEYMQLVDTICRYQCYFPLKIINHNKNKNNNSICETNRRNTLKG